MEDSVDETESVKRYNQYKLDFRRQQLQDFFLQHKDQEWFRSKYHPDDITARRAESLAALKTRLGVFLFLLDSDWLDDVSLDMGHAPAIIKLLDAGRGGPSPYFPTLFILMSSDRIDALVNPAVDLALPPGVCPPPPPPALVSH